MAWLFMVCLLGIGADPLMPASMLSNESFTRRMEEWVREGGHLIVVEPTFSPAPALGLVFWVKKVVTTVTRRRIGVFGRWNNIGAPVVSYLTKDELVALLAAVGGCRVDEVHEERLRVGPLLRLALITGKSDTTVVVRKVGVKP